MFTYPLCFMKWENSTWIYTSTISNLQFKMHITFTCEFFPLGWNIFKNLIFGVLILDFVEMFQIIMSPL